jgi:hypothetical protein
MNKTVNRYPEGKIYFSDQDDILDYLKSGKRRNINRQKAFSEGKKITLANRDEQKFIAIF